MRTVMHEAFDQHFERLHTMTRLPTMTRKYHRTKSKLLCSCTFMKWNQFLYGFITTLSPTRTLSPIDLSL